MTRRVRIQGKRTVSTYTTLRAVSWYANRLATTDSRARANHLLTSMAFDAFALEAYLNHLGAIRIPFWESLKRKLSPHEKLDVLSTDLGFKPDFGRRPWQSFREIFKLRALLAHAETETLPFEGEVEEGSKESIPLPLASWEEFMTVGTGQKFLDDTKAMIKDLAKRAGISADEVFAKDSIEAATTLLGDSEVQEVAPA